MEEVGVTMLPLSNIFDGQRRMQLTMDLFPRSTARLATRYLKLLWAPLGDAAGLLIMM